MSIRIGTSIGLMVGCLCGIGWVSSIYPNVDLDGIEYLIPYIMDVGVIIGGLSILGAVIGFIIGAFIEYYAGSTSSKT